LATPVEELALIGKQKSDPRAAEAELIPAGQDLGATPNLFDNGLSVYSARVQKRQRMLEADKQQHQQREAMPE
jgi:hypothetical protein